jgi:hypothetical protein
MARYLAICSNPGITEEQFRSKFDRIKKWRPDRRTWVIKAYCGYDSGDLVIECETPDKSNFDEWLENTGWNVKSVNEINLIHEAGTVWAL